jgi:acyl-CoA hydrolase
MKERKEKHVAESFTTMTELVMPNDTNPLDNLMGGNLMRWMDIAGSICAGRHCESHVVTASVDHVSFHQAIHVGDVVTLTAQITRAFTTSVEVYVEVFKTTIKGGSPKKSNHAFFTFVALEDESKKPKPVPLVIPLTEMELKLYEASNRRREIRLILSGRIKPEQATEVKDFFASM